jgi:hypothetical protein
MLNTIKNLINEKTSFLEEADLIFEDATLGHIDDAIVLGEAENPDKELDDIEGDNDEPKLDDSDDADDESSEDDDIPEEDKDNGNDDEDILDTSVEDNDESEPTPPSNDVLDQPVDDPASDNDIPPLDADDFLDVEIDLKTNTMKDILPVPPAGAGDAVGDNDDILNARVDSGFEDDEPSSPTEPAGESDDIDDNVDESDESIDKESSVDEMGLKSNNEDDFLDESIDDSIDESATIDRIKNNAKDLTSTIKKGVDKIADAPNKIANKKIKNGMNNIKGGLKNIIDHSAERLKSNNEDDFLDEEKELAESVYDELMEKGLINYNVSFDQFMEAISLGGDGATVPPVDDGTSADDAMSTDPTMSTDPAPDTTGAPVENDVTAAVRDKVAEADTDTSVDNQAESKDELLKKLGNITKSLEDAKKAVMNSIQ